MSSIPGVDYTQRWWDDVDEGEALVRIEDVITYGSLARCAPLGRNQWATRC